MFYFDMYSDLIIFQTTSRFGSLIYLDVYSVIIIFRQILDFRTFVLSSHNGLRLGVSDPLRSGFIQGQCDCLGFGSKSIFFIYKRRLHSFYNHKVWTPSNFFKFYTSIENGDHTAILSFSDKLEILEPLF